MCWDTLIRRKRGKSCGGRLVELAKLPRQGSDLRTGHPVWFRLLSVRCVAIGWSRSAAGMIPHAARDQRPLISNWRLRLKCVAAKQSKGYCEIVPTRTPDLLTENAASQMFRCLHRIPETARRQGSYLRQRGLRAPHNSAACLPALLRCVSENEHRI